MSWILDPAVEQVYRIGRCGLDPNGARYFFSETWHINRPANTSSDYNFLNAGTWQRWHFPFGVGLPALGFQFALVFAERVWPPKASYFHPANWTTRAGPTLNVAAPEAAFRLQRVGANLVGAKSGRVCLPIRNDSVYLDLPHRRLIDVATLAPLLAAEIVTYPMTYTSLGVTNTNVIFSRETLEVTPVTSYALLPNPIRCWQRWREYPQPNHDPAKDVLFRPPYGH